VGCGLLKETLPLQLAHKLVGWQFKSTNHNYEMSEKETQLVSSLLALKFAVASIR